MMDRTSRILTTAAALLLLVVYALPLWRIDLLAPQYPEGIGMLIRIDDVQGVKPQDLANINSLNHYIGMKEIHAASIPELRWMPWLVGALVATGLLVAAWGRRRALAAWLGAFLLLGLAGLADFWRWSYEYGHDLSPDAIIKVPGMSYQPPVIGTKQLLNFTASSWPSWGGIAAGLAFALGALALVRAWRQARGGVRLRVGAAVPRAALAALLAAGLAMAACAPAGPRALRYGQEPCGYCRMTITDRRFGGQVANAHGKLQVFDSVECLADFVAAAEPAPPRAWVADFQRPGTFIAVENARFVRLARASSPMGAGLAAVSALAPTAGIATEGPAMTWDELVGSRRAARAPGAAATGESGHAH